MIFTYYFQDKNLKRSVTSPASVSDWLNSNPTAVGADTVEKGNIQMENHYPRQRTWSARTFHDFLAPLPQLQKKWCSWTTNSPFTKLVDNSVSLAKRGVWGGQVLCSVRLLMGHVFPLAYCFASPTCKRNALSIPSCLVYGKLFCLTIL